MVETALQGPLTREQREFLHAVADDTEEAPWMVMGDGQFHAATNLYLTLETYVVEQGLGWYVGGMLPIRYPDPETAAPKVIAPDVLVARVARRARQSYDLREEGVFPQFVVEVVSPDGSAYDDAVKGRLYRLLGAREYVLYAPQVPGEQATRLWGYRRDAEEAWAAWPPDDQGRLWSAELGLWLVGQEREIRAALPDGRLLPTLRESHAAQQRAEQERAREAAARQRAEEEWARAEAEIARLRAALERTHGAGPGPDTGSLAGT